MDDPIISFENVSLSLGGTAIFDRLNLSINPGELIVILGPNGAGKTTFLRLILGLLHPNAGAVRVLGHAPRKGDPLIGYAPQHRPIDVDLPLRARDLVGFGLDGHRWGFSRPDPARKTKIDQALAEVDALRFADSPVGRLSGGEQQRLLIAQTLLTDPRLLLLDEPLASLDLARQQETVELVSRVCRTRGVTVLLVSHDINPLLHVTDRVLFLAHGQSAIGAPDDVICSDCLSHLYNSPVDVVHADGRYFVVGAEI